MQGPSQTNDLAPPPIAKVGACYQVANGGSPSPVYAPPHAWHCSLGHPLLMLWSAMSGFRNEDKET